MYGPRAGPAISDQHRRETISRREIAAIEANRMTLIRPTYSEQTDGHACFPVLGIRRTRSLTDSHQPLSFRLREFEQVALLVRVEHFRKRDPSWHSAVEWSKRAPQ